MKKQFAFTCVIKGFPIEVFGYQQGDSYEVTAIKIQSGAITLNRARIGAACHPLENAINKEVLGIIKATAELNGLLVKEVEKYLGLPVYREIFGELTELNTNIHYDGC